jgi:hypothetical protein
MRPNVADESPIGVWKIRRLKYKPARADRLF